MTGKHNTPLTTLGAPMRKLLPLLTFLVPATTLAQTPQESPLAVETFDRAWTIIHKTYFDTTFAGLDWHAVRDELRPEVIASPDQKTVRRVIRDMLNRFGQSHFSLIPAEIADSLDPNEEEVRDAVGGVGLDVRLVENQVLVTKVDAGGSAEQAGVRPGWIVTAVGDDRVDDMVERTRSAESRRHISSMVWGSMQYRLRGAPGTECTLEFLDGSDQTVVLTLTRTAIPNEPVKFGNLPTIFARFERGTIPLSDGMRHVGVVWFNTWMVPLIRQLDGAIDDFREFDGLVIDLRGNGGGLGAMVMGVAGHVLNEKISLGTMKTRAGDLQFRVNPRRVNARGEPVKPLDGPVAVLIDRLSGSASEVFAGGLLSLGRIRVFGDTSAGAVLPATMDRLPNRDVLYHAIGDFETATGVRLEGRGVYPDEVVPLSREALLAGKDPVLEASLRWITETWGASPDSR
jgi:carboxyl-terminal processing protease